MKTNLSPILALLAVLTLACCHRGAQNSFTADGTISGAEGQVLYLEATSADEPALLDSVTLGKDGRFSFEGEARSYPLFFRLRLGEEFIPFAADSLTHLSVTADGKHLFASYRFTKAEPYNEAIREISHLRWATDQKIEAFADTYPERRMTIQEAQQHIDSLSAELKEVLTSRFIYKDPKSPAAYFALLQTYKGADAYFSLTDPRDARTFAAVATAYDTYYPQAPYTALLKQYALTALANQRASQRAVHPDSTLASKQVIVDYPELSLKDKSGKVVSLTETASRGPVLLSFTSYSSEWSPALVAQLRAFHEAHPEITIYEVSLDRDSYFWKNATRTLPWISVNDPEGTSITTYNVQQLPSFFSIRGSELKRLTSPQDMTK